MAATHTKGPWKLLPLEDGVEYLRIRGTQLGLRYKVCNVHAPFQHNAAEVLESQANARLIAAAPCLLEALEEARNGLLWYRDAYPAADSQADDEAMARIDAAISKATGEAL